MPDALKDLDYYAAHPDEMPTDEASLAALLGEGADETDDDNGKEPDDTGDGKTKDPDEQSEQDRATDGADETADAGAQDEGDEADDETPILTKDGKRTIPYNVLATEREKRRVAENAQRELMTKIADLEARATGQRGAAAGESTGETDTSVDLMSDEELGELVTDFPAIKKLIGYVKTLEGRVGQFESQAREREETERTQQQREVRDAVDANPTLLYWEQHDQERWQAAIEADSRLSQLPVNQGLSLEERFEKAVQVVETIYGPTELPDNWARKGSNTPSGKSTKPTPSGESTDAALAEKARRAVEKAGSARPRTLSEMPGGAVPASDPLEDFASLSAERLGAQMANMTPDQISALLARLG